MLLESPHTPVTRPTPVEMGRSHAKKDSTLTQSRSLVHQDPRTTWDHGNSNPYISQEDGPQRQPLSTYIPSLVKTRKHENK
jgi:hypothetical protein